MKRHVVMFSGGVGSWAAAIRVINKVGKDNIVLLFADTLIEDEDLYRFIDEAAADLGVPITRAADGRDPWEVFFDEKFLGNSRVDPCSKILKRQKLDSWLKENCDPDNTVVYVGIDWSEEHRFTTLKERKLSQGWSYEAPLCSPPFLSKAQMIMELQLRGIRPPRLYAMGFSHNNCGGFCVKAGQAHWANLLNKMPERYKYHEGKEKEIREYLGKDVSILVDRRGGKRKPLTLESFRKRVESGVAIDRFDFGGCGCFSGSTEPEQYTSPAENKPPS
jgi:hypothetical protein